MTLFNNFCHHNISPAYCYTLYNQLLLHVLHKKIMSKHPQSDKDLNYIYYLVAILSGIFVGAIIGVGFKWVIVGAILGFLTAAFFVNVLARSSEEA
jgi:hypothetical protein